MDQPPARGDQRQGVFKRKDLRQTCGHVFAYAVADHRLRANAPVHPQLRQGILDDEERGLGDDCLRQLLRGLLDLIRPRIKNGSQVEFQMGFEQVATPVHFLAERRLGLVHERRHLARQRRTVADVAPLQRSDQFLIDSGVAHAVRDEVGAGVEHGFRVRQVEEMNGDALTNDHPPVAKGLSTNLQSKGHVGQADSGVSLEVLAQIRRDGVERGFGFGREQQ